MFCHWRECSPIYPRLPPSAMQGPPSSLPTVLLPGVFALEAMWHGPTAQVARLAPSMASSFSSDGQKLAVGTHDFASGSSALAILSSEGGAASLMGIDSRPPGFTGFDSDASRVYFIRVEDDVIHGFSLPTGEPLESLDIGTGSNLILSGDGRFLLTVKALEDGTTEVRKWSVDTHELIAEKTIPGYHSFEFKTRVDADPAADLLAYNHGGEIFVVSLDDGDSAPSRKVGSHGEADLVVFHPTEPVVVSADNGTGEFRFWPLDGDPEVPVRTLVFKPFLHSTPVRSQWQVSGCRRRRWYGVDLEPGGPARRRGRCC